MSYDLAFWTGTPSGRSDPSAVHAQLVNEDPVDGLGDFDAAGTLAALQQYLPGPTSSEEPHGSTAWEDEGSSMVFEFSWSPQHLTATARGSYSGDQMNAIIDAAVDVGGGRLYDPQLDERFDDG